MNKQPDELNNGEFKEYCYKDEWTLAEAIFLLRGKRPKNIHDCDNEIFIKFTQNKSGDIDSQMRYEMDPEDWLVWAMSKDIDIDTRIEIILSPCHKKTVNDVNPFGKPTWNINQVFAWMYSRDPELVKLFDDEVEDYGTHTNKSGEEVPNRSPRVEDIYNYEHPQGVTPEFNGPEDVESSLIEKLLNNENELECLGIENNQGQPKPIPNYLWAYLVFNWGGDTKTIAVSSSVLHQHDLGDVFEEHDETEWHLLKLQRNDILRIWPDNKTQRQEKSETTWSDVKLTIHSGSLISAEINGVLKKMTLSEFGFYKKNANKPTVLLELFIEFAKNTPVKTSNATSQRVRRLAKLLNEKIVEIFNEKITVNGKPSRVENHYYLPQFKVLETISSTKVRAREPATSISYEDIVQTEQGFEELTETEKAAELERLTEEQDTDKETP